MVFMRKKSIKMCQQINNKHLKLQLRFNVPGKKLFNLAPNQKYGDAQSRNINLLVAVSLPLDLAEDVDAVVVAQRPGHLIVVHGQVVLLDTPQPGH